MLKKNIIMVLLLLGGNLAAMAATKVYVEDFTATAGSEVEISICINTNMTDVDLIEGEIEFPSQLVVLDNAYGSSTRVKVDDQRAPGFVGNFNPSTNLFRMQAVSSSITGDGTVAYMKLRAASDIPASSTVILKDFRIRHKGGDYEDVTAINASVTGQTASSANITLQCEPSVLSIQPGMKGTVELKVETTGNITGLQGVLTMGSDLAIASVTKGEAAGSPVILTYNPDNGNLIYFGSMDNVSGTLVILEIEAATTFSGDETITFGDIVATDASSVRIPLDDITLSVSDEATGIRQFDAETKNSDSIYNLSGQKVSKNYKGITIRNGKKVITR